jgi:hypothetical protein
MNPLRLVPVLALFCAGGCGFGTYDDSASPSVTGSSTGVPDAGQWWPFVCPDGSNPSPNEPPENYLAAGSCGDGGTLTLDVDGCELFANWDVLGLTAVVTAVPTDTPDLGGWIITAAPDNSDAGWTCAAGVPASVGGSFAFTCSTSSPAVTACQSTLTPMSGP